MSDRPESLDAIVVTGIHQYRNGPRCCSQRRVMSEAAALNTVRETVHFLTVLQAERRGGVSPQETCQTTLLASRDTGGRRMFIVCGKAEMKHGVRLWVSCSLGFKEGMFGHVLSQVMA